MTTIAIVGLGVVGGSFAKAIKENPVAGERVLAIDHNPETIRAAVNEGVIEAGETENKTILQQADIVIFALYPKAMKEFVKTHKTEFKPGAIVTDTAGVKGALMEQMAEDIPADVDFIFGHPMAGREHRGYAYADASVFKGANYLLTPTDDNKAENIETLEILLNRLGFKRVSIVSPQKHDEMIGFTSQLCHAIAVALINSDDPERDTVHFIGDSYRDLTRIAKINETLWSELFQENKVELLKAMDDFDQQFQLMKQAVQNDDHESMQAMFIKSTERRERLDRDDLKKK